MSQPQAPETWLDSKDVTSPGKDFTASHMHGISLRNSLNIAFVGAFLLLGYLVFAVPHADIEEKKSAIGDKNKSFFSRPYFLR